VAAAGVVWGIARLATWLFYRVERVGGPVPPGPVLVVANHPNALLDPALVVATAGREPRFLAKSTLFSTPVISWLVKGAGAIPVYRRMDAGADTTRNTEMFAAVEQALRAGDAVCLFPEGTTHSRGRLDPLKTGAARIALSAAASGIPVRLVAAGINLDRKAALRSPATVAYGTPFGCEHLLDGYASDPREAVDRLTGEIARHIADLVVEAEPVNEAALVIRIDRIYRAAQGLADDPARRLERRQVIGERLLPSLRADHPEMYDDLVGTVRRYDHRLARFGLTEGMVGGDVSREAAVRFGVRETARFVALLPVLAAGVVVFAAPYGLIKWLSSGVLPLSLEVQATSKVLGAALIYPVWIVAVATAAGLWFGAGWGWLTLALLPVLAIATLFGLEREESVIDTSRAYFAWQRMSPAAARAMIAHRRAIAEAIDRLGPPPGPGRPEGPERSTP
jgi:1-acyl-sn-glycerol-3-phosphate acyltransferase